MRIVHWFRRDLRLEDNTALAAAVHDADGEVIPTFVLDPDLLGLPGVAPARVDFMMQSLRRLDADLRRRGSSLLVLRGNPAAELARVVYKYGASRVYYNRDHTPLAARRDERVGRALREMGCGVYGFDDQLVAAPTEVYTAAGRPYGVFTPYKRVWIKLTDERDLKATPLPGKFGVAGLMGDASAWDLTADVADFDVLGVLRRFVGSEKIYAYAKLRDSPSLEGTSRLSPHLRFGTVSARQCVRLARESAQRADSSVAKAAAEAWINELIWRDFYAQVLFHHPLADRSNFRSEYDRLEWGSGDAELDAMRLEAWCAGHTGYPIVDAAMRQLNQTGWMHNRGRMIVASFLTKDLLLDWRLGEAYFMRHLIDGDPASNNGGWQWAAGTGTDAQPYFRVFNPVLQSERFDPDGEYIRRFVPELGAVPRRHVHAPWTMPPEAQRSARCVIGHDYPFPIVDHAAQKAISIARFRAVRSSRLG